MAPFSQPIDTSQLIAGRIPENQGRIPKTMLPDLDRRFRHILLTESHRTYSFIELPPEAPKESEYHSSEQPQALPRWIAYGKRHGAQMLLVPMVMDWHQREGSRGGVTRPAHMRLEFFLLNVADGSLAARSSHEEEQVGLADNLLTVGSFIKRRGAWVTAEDLSAEGMHKAVKELGL